MENSKNLKVSARGLLLALVFLSGCGDERPQAGFVNYTHHSDAQLWKLWQAAQRNLSERIDLNPVQRGFNNAPAHFLPGDARVWQVSPRQLAVVSEPDVAPAVLYAATGVERANPTGLIACPQPCNVQFAPAYSLYRKATSRYAASWESSEASFDFLLQYEFENQILYALGYDVRWR